MRKKKSSENYPQFWHASLESFAIPFLDLRILKNIVLNGHQISCPLGKPIYLGPALATTRFQLKKISAFCSWTYLLVSFGFQNKYWVLSSNI